MESIIFPLVIADRSLPTIAAPKNLLCFVLHFFIRYPFRAIHIKIEPLTHFIFLISPPDQIPAAEFSPQNCILRNRLYPYFSSPQHGFLSHRSFSCNIRKGIRRRKNINVSRISKWQNLTIGETELAPNRIHKRPPSLRYIDRRLIQSQQARRRSGLKDIYSRVTIICKPQQEICCYPIILCHMDQTLNRRSLSPALPIAVCWLRNLQFLSSSCNGNFFIFLANLYCRVIAAILPLYYQFQ